MIIPNTEYMRGNIYNGLIEMASGIIYQTINKNKINVLFGEYEIRTRNKIIYHTTALFFKKGSIL